METFQQSVAFVHRGQVLPFDGAGRFFESTRADFMCHCHSLVWSNMTIAAKPNVSGAL